MKRLNIGMAIFLVAVAILGAERPCMAGVVKPAYATYAIRTDGFQINAAVMAFEVRIDNGGLESISGIPMGWNIVVDNDASWVTRVSGTITIGAAALTRGQFEKIHFHIVRGRIEGQEFRMSGSISVFVRPDVEQERSIQLSSGNFHVLTSE